MQGIFLHVTKISWQAAKALGLMKVSIITVVFNGERYIADAINSIKNQEYENIEHIIIDGLSTDRTPKIIEDHKTTKVTVLRESDNGLYDAMNKGISIATGDIIGILNSDDWYEPNTIREVVAVFAKNNDLELVYGAMRRINANGAIAGTYGSKESMPDSLSAPFNHPACFTKKHVYKKIGLFDTNFPTAADYDWMLRLKKAGILYSYHDIVLANFRLTGVTGSSVGFPQKQITSVLRKNGYSIAAVTGALAYRYGARLMSAAAKALPGKAYVRLRNSLAPYAKN